MRILIGARFLQKLFNNVLVKKLFLKAKENLALISWVLSYYLNQYFIKTSVFNIFLAIYGCLPIYYVTRDHRKQNERIFFF